MNSRSRGFFSMTFMLMLVASLTLPATASTQRGRRRAAREERRAEDGAEAQLRQRAKTAGYRSGKQAGLSDRKRGEPSNFRDESAYQQATRGYSPQLGDKEHYKMYFREAFENGYRDGWNGY